MMKFVTFLLLAGLLVVAPAAGFAPVATVTRRLAQPAASADAVNKASSSSSSFRLHADNAPHRLDQDEFNFDYEAEFDDQQMDLMDMTGTSPAVAAGLIVLTLIATIVMMMMGIPEAALAADAGTTTVVASSPLASALAAYFHYLGIITSAVLLALERFILTQTSKPFTQDDEELLTKVDSAYGIVSVPVLVSGYLRATKYGKGFAFYQHTPFFWLKIASAGVIAACSFFVTTIIIKRALDKKNAGDVYTDLSPALQARMVQVINAELGGFLFVPLFATLMARGVGYNEVVPWQAEAALAAVIFAGASFKYVKDALTWKEEDGSSGGGSDTIEPAVE